MLLNESSYKDVEENPEFFFYCALLHEQPCNFSQMRESLQRIENQEELIQTLREILPDLSIYTPAKIDELFSKAVGEIGMFVQEFWNMTEEEIDLAYEGYLHKKELEANLLQLVLKQKDNNINNLIKITEDRKYQKGSIKEREETFLTLGLKEA